jgi:hypothetical protein
VNRLFLKNSVIKRGHKTFGLNNFFIGFELAYYHLKLIKFFLSRNVLFKKKKDVELVNDH